MLGLVDRVTYTPYEEAARPATVEHIFDVIHRAEPKNRQDICQTRSTRAQVLFAKGIAGKKGKSPGKGGTYTRTPESAISCERSL